MKKSHLVALVSSIGISISTANVAQASFVLTLDDTSTVGIDVIVSDDATPGSNTASGLTTTHVDSFGGLGTMTYVGSAGGFNVNVTTGTSKPLLPNGVLDLNSIDVSGIAGTLVIGLTDTSYSGTPPAYTSNYGGTTTGTVDFDFRHDPANTEFSGALTSIFNSGPVGSGAFSGSSTNAIAAGSLYSLSIFATITHGADVQNTSFNAELRPVPVPAAVWLFGSGLLGLVGIARRKAA